jgi:hypothetical protein
MRRPVVQAIWPRCHRVLGREPGLKAEHGDTNNRGGKMTTIVDRGCDHYGRYYWCIKTTSDISSNGEIYVMADDVVVTEAGALEAYASNEERVRRYTNLAALIIQTQENSRKEETDDARARENTGRDPTGRA